jgi:hypothetical protein
MALLLCVQRAGEVMRIAKTDAKRCFPLAFDGHR